MCSTRSMIRVGPYLPLTSLAHPDRLLVAVHASSVPRFFPVAAYAGSILGIAYEARRSIVPYARSAPDIA
eukprot:3749581-Rhodomonas_salina.3